MTERKSLSRVGNYQLTGRCLGKGSFAKVHEAVHLVLKTTVALKTMNITEMSDHYMKKHFKREALLLSKLNHPGIVALFETMESRNHYFMAMEIGEQNLCEFVRAEKRGRLDEITARSIARQLVSAVSHMHSKCIVHRDIKLENILINTAIKKVKLADFGLSNSWDKLTYLKTHCGSPEYAAPELHAGKSYGFEVDIWALGVVLFGMVVGRLPFEVEMKKPVSNQHRRELFLDETRRGVKTKKHQTFMGSASFLFKDLVSKMLSPSRQQRFTILQVEKHQWVIGVFIEEFSSLDEKWKERTFQKYAKDYDLPSVEQVKAEIERSPYGSLGGVYNIEKHAQQMKEFSLKRATSACKMREIKISRPRNALLFNRPTTSVANNLIQQSKIPIRPKTAQGKAGAFLKPFEVKLREVTHL